jgi:TRAP-type C4-dicarboxylate transport system permease small subunit
MAGRITYALDSADRGLQALNALVLCVMLVAMLGCVFANVVSRYLFAVSFAWAEEAARFMMIWTVFLGAGLALRHGLHVAVTLLPDALPPLRKPLFWIGLAVTFTFFALLMRYGFDYALFASRQRSTILRLPMIWVYMAVPVGAGLAMAHMVLGLRAAPLWAGPALPEATGAAR